MSRSKSFRIRSREVQDLDVVLARYRLDVPDMDSTQESVYLNVYEEGNGALDDVAKDGGSSLSRSQTVSFETDHETISTGRRDGVGNSHFVMMVMETLPDGSKEFSVTPISHRFNFEPARPIDTTTLEEAEARMKEREKSSASSLRRFRREESDKDEDDSRSRFRKRTTEPKVDQSESESEHEIDFDDLFDDDDVGDDAKDTNVKDEDKDELEKDVSDEEMAELDERDKKLIALLDGENSGSANNDPDSKKSNGDTGGNGASSDEPVQEDEEDDGFRASEYFGQKQRGKKRSLDPEKETADNAKKTKTEPAEGEKQSSIPSSSTSQPSSVNREPVKSEQTREEIFESEIRAILLRKKRVALRELIDLFRGRVRDESDKKLFRSVLAKIAEVRKEGSSAFLVLRRRFE